MGDGTGIFKDGSVIYVPEEELDVAGQNQALK